jgi:predicted  nucleic acid-binding Zn-ribbon protein
MASVKDFSVEEKLTSLVRLQKIDCKLDEIQILKGELPMEVKDLEDEIEGLHARQTRVEEEINGMQEFINQKIFMHRGKDIKDLQLLKKGKSSIKSCLRKLGKIRGT